MKALLLEVRDKATFIPVLAVDMNPVHGERYLLKRGGYSCDGTPIILLTSIQGSRQAFYDPYDWKDRTFKTAHLYIQEHWNELKTGDVIDVEFILGETSAKKVSESEEWPL